MSEEGPVQHWGILDEGLLFDQARYASYAHAHHAAAHQWAMRRLGAAGGPAGLSLALPLQMDPTAVADVEAASVLVETLAIEYARDLWRLAAFGLVVDDVDWDSVRENRGMVLSLAIERGCSGHTAQIGMHLGDEAWTRDTAWYALRDWDEISALADAFGRGQVLEGDEVERTLRWW